MRVVVGSLTKDGSLTFERSPPPSFFAIAMALVKLKVAYPALGSELRHSEIPSILSIYGLQ